LVAAVLALDLSLGITCLVRALMHEGERPERRDRRATMITGIDD
jgi:hypothetical protein